MLGSLGSALQTLRQPRYATLSVLMLVVALICVGAGTWQIARFDGKVSANDALRANAHRATVPVSQVLPLTSSDATVKGDRVRYRTVTATGSYDATHEALVRNRTVGGNSDDDGDSGDDGYLVLTPLQTTDGDLLVVRGFVASTPSGAVPTVTAPPSGRVTVRARVQVGETRDDDAARLSADQVESINPADQQQRLGRPVFDGYAELLARQPGTQGVSAIPAPDLSNPAGGAVEPQHFAYIIQWYLFALLALAAPFAMARAERREQAANDPEPAIASEPSAPPTPEQERAARLADRYGKAVR